MKKLYIIMTALTLSLNIKAQDWAPLDTGYVGYIAGGLSSDTANGNLFTFGNTANVFHNGKWELWYPGILVTNSNYPIIPYQNKKNLFLKNFLKNGDISKPCTAVLRFSNANDLDTLFVMTGKWSNGNYTYRNNKLVLTLGPVSGSTVTYNSIAEFDGTTFTALGKPSWNGMGHAAYECVMYKNELYAAGGFDSTIAVLKPEGWKILYPGIKGSNHSVSKLLIYNNRLYVIGGFWKFENSNNPGNSIAAWDGEKWDDLGGGAHNEFVAINAGFDDAVVCNNKLYLVGPFTSVSGIKAQRMVSWNDTTWCTICTNTDSCLGRIWRIECLNDTIYSSGAFNPVNGKNIGSVAKLLNMNFNDTCSGPYFAGITNYKKEYPNNLKLHPNPASNILHITTEQNQNTFSEIEITNSLGQTLIKQVYNPEVDVSQLPPGCYVLKIISKNKQVYHAKFLRE